MECDVYKIIVGGVPVVGCGSFILPTFSVLEGSFYFEGVFPDGEKVSFEIKISEIYSEKDCFVISGVDEKTGKEVKVKALK